jgi:CysZ protein
MMSILKSFSLAFLDLFHSRILALLFVPPIVSVVVWGGLGYIFWSQLLMLSQVFTRQFLFNQQMPTWMIDWFAITPDGVATALAAFVSIALLLPMVVLSSVLLTSVLAMPVVISRVGKDFPQLQKTGASTLIASVPNLVKASLIYLILWVLTLPLWMIPGLGVAIPILLNGYLNYRLFAFDTLGDYAGADEIRSLLARKRVDFLLVGVIIAVLYLILPLFLILPVYSALCFARFSMEELQEFRAQESSVSN